MGLVESFEIVEALYKECYYQSMIPPSKSSNPTSMASRGAPLKDKRDKTVRVSTVKFLNVRVVENKEDLLHLITNVLKNYSKQSATLKQMRASATSITCEIITKKVAIALARKVASAFKKYKPEVNISTSRKQDHHDITVVFQDVE